MGLGAWEMQEGHTENDIEQTENSSDVYPKPELNTIEFGVDVLGVSRD